MRLAGGLLVVAGVVALMGIITAEGLVPADVTYRAASDTISRLGVGPAGQPALVHVLVFNLSLIASGLLLASAGGLLWGAGWSRLLAVALLLYGLGTLAVGIFPAFLAVPHYIAALLTFFSGGIAALLSARVVRGPLRWIAVAAGVVGLAFIPLTGLSIDAGLVGIAERWIVYPVTLWTIAFGGYLLGSAAKEAGRA